jgi:HSP20 family protein
MMRSRWTILLELDEVQRQMEQFLSHVSSLKSPELRFSSRFWEPPVDVYETEGEVVVLVELAGVDRSMIKVVLEGQVLKIYGERPKIEGEATRYHRMEISFGNFERLIELPTQVDPEKAEVRYENGFLRIVLPKLVPKTRHIEIK